MPLNEQAKNVIERSLPKEKIKQRPGKAGMTYDYVTPDFIISLLNEAFDYRWSTDVFHQTMYGDTAVVGLNLSVWDAENNCINKAQFGSCDVGRGMGPGEAFKGATSDAMKNAATLLGVALELYGDDETTKPQFQKPTVPTRAPAPPVPPKAPSAAPAPPRPPTPLQAAPAPPGPAPAAPAAPVPAPAVPAAPVAPAAPGTAPSAAPVVATPPKPVNPFANGGTPASVPKPAPPMPPKPVEVSAPRTNPFASKASASGPNSTQINALTNLAEKKGLGQSDMVALAGVIDSDGSPKQTFEELTHAEAIQVIKASQL